LVVIEGFHKDAVPGIGCDNGELAALFCASPPKNSSPSACPIDPTPTGIEVEAEGTEGDEAATIERVGRGASRPTT
jgi:hypothetical protein